MEEQEKVNSWKEATSGDVVKFEKPNDSIQGVYLCHEQSTLYEDSYAVKVSVGEATKVVFVSKIVVDFIKSTNIQVGQQIRIVFLGMKETKDKRRKYKDYKVYYK